MQLTIASRPSTPLDRPTDLPQSALFYGVSDVAGPMFNELLRIVETEQYKNILIGSENFDAKGDVKIETLMPKKCQDRAYS